MACMFWSCPRIKHTDVSKFCHKTGLDESVRRNHGRDSMRWWFLRCILFWEETRDRNKFMGAIGNFLIGVCVTAFCGLVLFTWRKWLFPCWQDHGYKGLRLDGSWNAEIKAKDGTFIFRLVMHQKFHCLTGHMNITKSANGAALSQSELKVSGEYWESFLQLNCKSCIDNKLSFSTLLLKSENGGNSLIGEYSFRDLSSDKILSHAIKFTK